MPRITHVLEAQQFHERLRFDLVELALYMRDNVWKTGGVDWLKGKTLIELFYQPSTRTEESFQFAFEYLGGRKIHNPKDPSRTSSAIKGENLDDTIRVYNGYVHDPREAVIVLRHPNPEAAVQAAMVSHIPIINAGCGKELGQHPTQALGDYTTIADVLQRIERRKGLVTVNLRNLHFVLGWDLKYARTARSLCYLLGKHANDGGIRLTFVSPPELRIGQDIKDYLARKGIPYEEYVNLREETLRSGDVFYWLRGQQEDHRGQPFENKYLEWQESYRLTPREVTVMKNDAIILHPFPRNSADKMPEIDPSVDAYPHAQYFRQMQYNEWVRMALLMMILK